MWSDLILGPSFQGQMRPDLKVLITRLLLVLVLTKYPEEVDIYLDPGIETPEDLAAADVPPSPSFLSEDN